jgi:hypothetical protein
MHSRHIAPSLWAFVGVAFLAGCLGVGPEPTTAAVSSPTMRRIFVTDPTGASTAEFAELDAAIHDAAVRSLRDQGFEVVAEPAQAQATVRFSWHTRPVSAGSPGARIQLLLRLEDRVGRTRFARDVITDMPLGFLSPSRVTDAVHTRLAELGPAPPEL